jgi:hypothetical protein
MEFILNSSKTELLPFRSYLAYTILIASALILAFGIQYPQIMSLWEGSVIYNDFRPDMNKPLPFLAIQRGGDSVGFHGLGYGTLITARWIADIFGHSLNVIRLPSVIYSLISLWLLFIITKRWFGPMAAFVAAGLLMTNYTFLTFQHTLIVQAVTLAGILFCIERLQNLNIKQTRLAAVTFGLACALTALHHVLGRICMLTILTIALVDYKRITEKNWKHIFTWISLERTKLWIWSFSGLVVSLFVFFPLNLKYFFKTQFIFSPLGEYSTEVSGSLNNFVYNLKFFWVYFLGFSGEESQAISDIMVSIPYPVESLFIWFVAIIGFGVCFKKREYPYIVIMLLFGILFMASMLSDTFPDRPGILGSTLSSYRLYYLIPFLITLVAIAFEEIIQRFSSKPIVVMGLVTGLFIIFGIRYGNYVLEVNSLNEMVGSSKYDFSQKAISKPSPDLYTVDVLRGMHLNQIYYYQLAQYISDEIKRSAINGQKFFYVDAERFLPDYYRYGGGDIPYKGHPYYFPMYLTFYLKGQGIESSYLVKKDDVPDSYLMYLIFCLKGQRIESIYLVKKDDVPDSYSQKVYRKLNKHMQGSKFIQFLQKQTWVKSMTEYLQNKKVSFEDRQQLGDYIVHDVGVKQPEFILLTDQQQVQTIRGIKSQPLVLKLPAI